MRPILWTPILWILLAALAYGDDRIGPSGIGGTLVVGTSESTKSHFTKLIAKSKAKTLIVSANEPLPATLKEWQAAEEIHIGWTTPETAAEKLNDATAAWLDGIPLQKHDKLTSALRSLMQRGGIVGVAGKQPIDDILPGGWIEFGELNDDRFAKRLAKTPGRFGIRLTDDAVLIVRDREIKAPEGVVSLGLAASEHRPTKIESVTKKGEADLNQWRRAALARTAAPYPPAKADVPEVKKGTLIIIGGGGMPKGGLQRFIELAGGPEAPIVVLPTSMPDPLPKTGGDGFLRKAGAKNVAVINARERKDVEDPANLELLRKARGIWFGGGRQWRFVDAYEGTKAYPLIHDVLARGGVIAGSSAGATIQGDYLARGSPLGPNIMMAEGYERAFGFLPGVAIDQHFAQRKRFGDMSALMKTYPQFLGIGLDEATAIIVTGHTAEVIGPGEVHFYDTTKKRELGAADYDSYKAGTRYDLKARHPISVGE